MNKSEKTIAIIQILTAIGSNESEMPKNILHHVGYAEKSVTLLFALSSLFSEILSKNLKLVRKTNTPKLTMNFRATMVRKKPTILDSVTATIKTSKGNSSKNERANDMSETKIPIFTALFSPFE